MTDQARIRVGQLVGGLSLVFGLVGAVMVSALGGFDELTSSFTANNAVNAMGFGLLVLVAVPTQPRNAAVWAFAWAAASSALLVVGNGVAFALLRSRLPGDLFLSLETVSPSELSAVEAMAVWPQFWAWVPGFFLAFTFGFLLSPDGRLPSPRWRWRWLGLTSGFVIAILTAISAWFSRPGSSLEYLANYPEPFGTIEEFSYLAVFVLILASVASLVARYRRSSGGARHQIRVVAWGGLSLFVFMMASLGVDIANENTLLIEPLLLLAGQVLFVAAFIVAISKYRLYDVDLIISKAVTFLALAAFIGAVYVSLVVVVSGTIDGGSNLVVSIAVTTVVAIAFQPVRRIVQRAANRFVYGRRATPYEVLAGFAKRTARSTDEELVERVPRLIVEGTSAATATLWLQTDHGLRMGSTWPQTEDADAPVTATITGVTQFVDPAADQSIPISDRGDLLGGLSLVIARGETITRADEALIADLAAGLGVALRNARRTTQLREQVAELRASRERVLAVADDARRALERDLDSGPLQHLQAIKAGVGPIRQQVDETGVEKVGPILAALETETETAIQSIEDFANGVYPPLLEAAGLGAALQQQAEQAAIPISIHDYGVQRQPNEIETAVYFTVLEALQNTAKHANAEFASVSLTMPNGQLEFEVRDNGRGFDPSAPGGSGLGGLKDRLEAVGGRIEIDSAPGQGTTIKGAVPTRPLDRNPHAQ